MGKVVLGSEVGWETALMSTKSETLAGAYSDLSLHPRINIQLDWFVPLLRQGYYISSFYLIISV